MSAQLQVYIELKGIEIRTETDSSSGAHVDLIIEEPWNQEPLDHTRHQGAGRVDYGCPFSRVDDLSFEVCLCLPLHAERSAMWERGIFVGSRGTEFRRLERGVWSRFKTKGCML